LRDGRKPSTALLDAALLDAALLDAALLAIPV
jgi:hypothetical protein